MVTTNLANAAIMVVDDELSFHELARAATADMGCTALRTATTIDEAKLLLREQPADIVLIDYSLPHACGAELARWIVEQPYLTHTVRYAWTFYTPTLIAPVFDGIIEKTLYSNVENIAELKRALQALWECRHHHPRSSSAPPPTDGEAAHRIHPSVRVPESERMGFFRSLLHLFSNDKP